MRFLRHTRPPVANSGSEPQAAQLRTDLKATVDHVAGRLLSRASQVALLDFPAYANVGDSAIWLGQMSFLGRCARRPRYMSDIATHSTRGMQRRIGDGTILLSGGGNFGDLWSKHQEFREHIVSSFPRNPIIQLPQSMHFKNPANLRKASGIFRRHKNVTILVRDEQSRELALRHLAEDVRMCPDMAFAIDDDLVREEPIEPILWLGRQDIEASGRAHPCPQDVHVADWPSTNESGWFRLGEYVRTQRALRPRLEPFSRAPLGFLYERIARARFRSGCSLLSQGRVVITDRLHGHILCLLLGIEHVLLDNSYGKLSRFYKCWTQGSPLAHWCDSSQEALETARCLAEGRDLPRPRSDERATKDDSSGCLVGGKVR